MAAQHLVGHPPKVVLIGCYSTSFYMNSGGSGGSGDSGENNAASSNGQLSVSRSVLALFDECFEVPLPFASQRRLICRQVYDSWRASHHQSLGHEKEVNSVILDLMDADLDALADKWTAQPTVTLCVRIKTYLNRAQRDLEIHQNTVKRTLADSHQKKKKNHNPESLSSSSFPKRQQQVFGQQAAKKALYEAIIWPRKYAKLIQEFSCGIASSQKGQTTTQGGNSGGGNSNVGVKTLIPRVLNTQLFAAFENDTKQQHSESSGPPPAAAVDSSAKSRGFVIEVRMRSVLRGEIGTGEKALVDIFNTAKRNAPSIIFIDEFQAAFTSRSGEVGGGAARDGVGFTLSATLAGCLDDLREWNRFAGLESTVIVLAATNEPWAVDPSFLRPGRLGECVFVGPLDAEGRQAYAQHLVAEQWATVLNAGCWRGEAHCTAGTGGSFSIDGDGSSNGDADCDGDGDDDASHLSGNTLDELVSVLIEGTDGFTGADMKLLGIRALREVLRSREEAERRQKEDTSAGDTSSSSSGTGSAGIGASFTGDKVEVVGSGEVGVRGVCTCISEIALSNELRRAYEAAILTCECSVSDEEVYDYLLWQRDR